MNLHEKIKAILTEAAPRGTSVAEVFLPFDAKNSSYRASTPAVIFRFEECIESDGLYRLTLRLDLLGKTAEVEALYKAICAAFRQQVNDQYWSVSLASGSFREAWDTDLNVDWGTVMLKGVAIEQPQEQGVKP